MLSLPTKRIVMLHIHGPKLRRNKLFMQATDEFIQEVSERLTMRTYGPVHVHGPKKRVRHAAHSACPPSCEEERRAPVRTLERTLRAQDHFDRSRESHA